MLRKIGVFKEMMGMKKIQKLYDDIKDKYEGRLWSTNWIYVDLFQSG